ncbi:hypothetical protein HOLleu_04796 [Holothuria leucospilota]|uniref:Uncharacterized protein n=1 Tax=Holothuria leucospilota TaxID=206669 RepID=A0A9Q1CIX0_HOLLE|nr:hypothetical protein HOLleu_04796 [Holothuria leucospilota]
MSSDQRGTRRSRRVPTTPSRFEDFDVGQPSSPLRKGTSSPGNRSPRGLKSSSKSASETLAKKVVTKSKQVTSASPVEEGTRALRSGSKRQVQQEDVQGEIGSSSVKKLKKENDNLEKKQTPSDKGKSSAVEVKTSAPVSCSQREKRALARSPRRSEEKSNSGIQPESSGLKRVQTPASVKTSKSSGKGCPSEPPRNTAFPVKKAPLGTGETVKFTPASGEVYKALKKAFEARAANDKGSKANQGPLLVTLVEEGSGLKYTIKVLASTKSSTNTAAEGQSTAKADTASSGSQPAQKVVAEHPPRNVTPKKNVQVDVIHASTHITSSDRSTPGLFASANKSREDTDEDSSERMTILPTTKGDTSPSDTAKGGTSRKRTPLRAVSVPPKVNGVEGKGRTIYTQTSMRDFRMCLMVNSQDSVQCADKVMKVSTEVIKKSRFRTTDLAAQTKQSQTVSVWDDLNYHILEALGAGEENKNDENSLTYCGLDDSDADKKIQNMLFGQDLDVALTKSQQGIPSNVIADPQKEKKRKPKNAKITMESWSIALAVMNPDV